MESLFFLIPLSVFIVLVVLIILWRSIFTGQFDNLDAEAKRILENDDLDQ